MGSRPRVLLTGASAGIGLVTARTLCQAGCEVWGTSRDVARLPRDLAGFHPLEMSLNRAESIRTAWQTARSESGGFEVVINNAGDGWFEALTDVTDEQIRAQFETLFFGPLLLLRLALPELCGQRGLLINVTSLAVRLPIPYMAAYSAAKAALASLTATLRLELAGGGVRVVDLQPGDIRTDFNDAMRPPADGRARAAWDAMAESMRTAPGPKIVAAQISRLVFSGEAPPTRVAGNFLQSRLAPLAVRFLPARWMEKMLLRHYRQDDR